MYFSWFPFAGFSDAVSFSLGGRFYVGLGWQYEIKDQRLFFCFTPEHGWMPIKDFPGKPRRGAVAFSIGDKAYVGLGDGSGWEKLTDFWVYDPATDAWDSLRYEFPGVDRWGAVGFSLNGKGYVGTGLSSGEVDRIGDFYEFTPGSGWTQVREATVNGRFDATVFTLGQEVYMCFGEPDCRDVKKFSADTRTWTALRSLVPERYPDITRSKATAVVISEKGEDVVYVFGGNRDCWACRYDPRRDEWTEIKDSGIPKLAIYFTIGGELYGVGGFTTMKFRPR